VTELRKANLDIKITVKPVHRQDRNVPGTQHVFSYTISIENNSEEVVKLTHRHWSILDGPVHERVIEGEGVVGDQPTLYPDEKYEYSSWCPIGTEYGVMRGYYTFVNLNTQEGFRVSIPEFLLLPSFNLN